MAISHRLQMTVASINTFIITSLELIFSLWLRILYDCMSCVGYDEETDEEVSTRLTNGGIVDAPELADVVTSPSTDKVNSSPCLVPSDDIQPSPICKPFSQDASPSLTPCKCLATSHLLDCYPEDSSSMDSATSTSALPTAESATDILLSRTPLKLPHILTHSTDTVSWNAGDLDIDLQSGLNNLSVCSTTSSLRIPFSGIFTSSPIKSSPRSVSLSLAGASTPSSIASRVASFLNAPSYPSSPTHSTCPSRAPTPLPIFTQDLLAKNTSESFFFHVEYADDVSYGATCGDGLTPAPSNTNLYDFSVYSPNISIAQIWPYGEDSEDVPCSSDVPPPTPLFTITSLPTSQFLRAAPHAQTPFNTPRRTYSSCMYLTASPRTVHLTTNKAVDRETLTQTLEVTSGALQRPNNNGLRPLLLAKRHSLDVAPIREPKPLLLPLQLAKRASADVEDILRARQERRVSLFEPGPGTMNQWATFQGPQSVQEDVESSGTWLPDAAQCESPEERQPHYMEDDLFPADQSGVMTESMMLTSSSLVDVTSKISTPRQGVHEDPQDEDKENRTRHTQENIVNFPQAMSKVASVSFVEYKQDSDVCVSWNDGFVEVYAV